jgi:hypothetical protein
MGSGVISRDKTIDKWRGDVYTWCKVHVVEGIDTSMRLSCKVITVTRPFAQIALSTVVRWALLTPPAVILAPADVE